MRHPRQREVRIILEEDSGIELSYYLCIKVAVKGDDVLNTKLLNHTQGLIRLQRIYNF